MSKDIISEYDEETGEWEAVGGKTPEEDDAIMDELIELMGN